MRISSFSTFARERGEHLASCFLSQRYTGGRLDGTLVGHSATRYARFAGVALDTQRFPDSPNNPAFPTATLEPGCAYESTTELRFGAAD